MSNDNQAFMKSMEEATVTQIQNVLKAVDKACVVLESATKEECPVDQGILRASLTHSAKLEKDKITGTVGSPLEIAPYVHQGTGLYAKDGKGRKTPWVYIKGSHSSKKSKKVYTLSEAKRVVAFLRKKGFKAYVTQGQKPNPFLDRAKLKVKTRIEKVLGGE